MHAGKRFYASVLTSDRRLEREMFGAAEMTGTVDRQRPGLAGGLDYLGARNLQHQPRRSRDSRRSVGMVEPRSSSCATGRVTVDNLAEKSSCYHSQT